MDLSLHSGYFLYVVLNVKDKVLPVYAMKAYRSRNTAPLILNLSTRWRDGGQWLT